MLAFSGGGTRAAAFSYGALRQLDGVRFHFNEATGEPEACASAESPQCRAMERTLLDEVDVISSVSGGSFTSAYYALHGREIFDPESPFHKAFLYHNVQRDLFSQSVYYPQNWNKLSSRIEIAANYYADHIFGDATFRALQDRKRPYLILNATDMSTGSRFEFTQEQFDLFCGDRPPPGRDQDVDRRRADSGSVATAGETLTPAPAFRGGDRANAQLRSRFNGRPPYGPDVNGGGAQTKGSRSRRALLILVQITMRSICRLLP